MRDLTNHELTALQKGLASLMNEIAVADIAYIKVKKVTFELREKEAKNLGTWYGETSVFLEA